MKSFASFGKILLGIVVISSCAAIIYDSWRSDSRDKSIEDINKTIEENLQLPPISISSPDTWSTIKSPLTVRGYADSKWFTDGNIEISLLSASGRSISTSVAKTNGDLMREGSIDFETVLEFPDNMKGKGFIAFTYNNELHGGSIKEYKHPVLFE